MEKDPELTSLMENALPIKRQQPWPALLWDEPPTLLLLWGHNEPAPPPGPAIYPAFPLSSFQPLPPLSPSASLSFLSLLLSSLLLFHYSIFLIASPFIRFSLVPFPFSISVSSFLSLSKVSLISSFILLSPLYSSTHFYCFSILLFPVVASLTHYTLSPVLLLHFFSFPYFQLFHSLLLLHYSHLTRHPHLSLTRYSHSHSSTTFVLTRPPPSCHTQHLNE